MLHEPAPGDATLAPGTTRQDKHRAHQRVTHLEPQEHPHGKNPGQASGAHFWPGGVGASARDHRSRSRRPSPLSSLVNPYEITPSWATPTQGCGALIRELDHSSYYPQQVWEEVRPLYLLNVAS
jgi:hypothetical protein